MCLKSDLHSANVSRATDTILCRKAFFNLHLGRANCYVYLTNLFFLLTRSSYCVQQKQLSRLVIIYLTYYYRIRSSSLVKLRADDRSDRPIIRHLLCAYFRIISKDVLMPMVKIDTCTHSLKNS